MEKRTNKNVKGITLIALVLTIIVMLILAGITINLTLGEDGIIKRAQEAGQTYKNSEVNEIADITSFEASVIPGKVAKTVDGVQYVGDGMGNLIPVPVGFSYLEGTKSTGFVIKNDTDGNEFVWVPCTIDGANGSIKYDRYAFRRDGWSSSQTLDSTTGKIIYNEEGRFSETKASDEELSVRSYEGFYIGRYETGVKDATINLEGFSETLPPSEVWTAYVGGKAVIKKEQEIWNLITRDKALEIATSLYSKSKDNVTSKLCNGYAWDTALKFIETKYPEYPTNSVGGVYNRANASISKSGFDTVHPCNIYDMGGNALEITTEINNDERYTRRGGYLWMTAAEKPAADRMSFGKKEATRLTGFRIILYI